MNNFIQLLVAVPQIVALTIKIIDALQEALPDAIGAVKLEFAKRILTSIEGVGKIVEQYWPTVEQLISLLVSISKDLGRNGFEKDTENAKSDA